VSKDGGYSVKSEPKPAATDLLYQFDIGEANGHRRLVGIDEAGRGPLAGPVVAAAVVLDLQSPIKGINDSKKLSAGKREQLFDEITKHAVAWATGTAAAEEIDRINILRATFLAMYRAVSALSYSWDLALVDGDKKIPHLPVDSQKTIIGGDARSASIAAASICAKVTRDRLMEEYHRQFPEYRFNEHKGYGTAFHRDCIKHLGVCEAHRKSFCSNLIMQTTLDL
jgi:ribonuclease HII